MIALQATADAARALELLTWQNTRRGDSLRTSAYVARYLADNALDNMAARLSAGIPLPLYRTVWDTEFILAEHYR